MTADLAPYPACAYVDGMAEEIRPFTIQVPDRVLDDLHERLRRTRFPDRELVDDWSQGVPLAYVREICRYWADAYDWRSREAELNRLEQFVTTIDGVDIHFVHRRSPDPDALPIVLTHGWPGSFVEFAKVVGPLANPAVHGGDAADAFHVVVPSLPGYGFSGKPTETGWGVQRFAAVWDELMTRLGYERYVAQGGDWGSAVTTFLGAEHADHCAGIHLNMAGSRSRGDATTPEAQRAVEKLRHYQEVDAGYRLQQATRPQTLGYGLADSPAGQAAWILEKFWSWTDCDGHPENALTRDEMLDDVTIYWVTNSATSSARLYWESAGGARPTVEVPTGCSVFPAEILPPVREWSEATFGNIAFWNTHDRGGHFAAFEQPAAFVDDLRACFRPLR